MQSLPEDVLQLLQYEAAHGPVADSVWHSHYRLGYSKYKEIRLKALNEYFDTLCYQAREKYGHVSHDLLTGIRHDFTSAHGEGLMETSFIRTRVPEFNQKLNECHQWMTRLRQKYEPLRPRKFLTIVAPREKWSSFHHDEVNAIHPIKHMEPRSIIGLYETDDFTTMPEKYHTVSDYDEFKMYESSICACYTLQRHLDGMAITEVLTEDEINDLYQFPFRYQLKW